MEHCNMSQNKVLSLSQVSQHKSKKDCWIVINGRVLNVTSFLEEHPGGDEVLLEVAGKDATKEFGDIGHSKAAHNLLLKYQVGVLQGQVTKDEPSSVTTTTTTKKKEMSAFVIKEKPRHYRALLDLFVPLVVAGSYFAYRYVTVINNVVN